MDTYFTTLELRKSLGRIFEGRTPPPTFPMVLGHQVVRKVQETGSGVKKFNIGDRVGIAWIYSACGKCRFCLSGEDNLYNRFRATCRDANGGYAVQGDYGVYTHDKEDFAWLRTSGRTGLVNCQYAQ